MRKGWALLQRGCGRVLRQDVSGWLVIHCGHPTALWPYFALSPQGERMFAPNGRGFRRLVDAQKAVERRVGVGWEA